MDLVASHPQHPGFPARVAALLPALLTAAILGLWTVDVQRSYESAAALLVLNLVFTTPVSAFISILSARSFLSSGQPGLLLMCCAMIVWGASSFVAVAGGRVGNFNITVHNLGVVLSAFCHLAAAVLITRSARPVVLPTGVLAVCGTAALASVGLIWLGATNDFFPVFFVDGRGGTPLRDFLLDLSTVMLCVTSALIWSRQRRHPSEYLRWYALGLALLAVGGLGLALQTVHGSLLGWTARVAQYLGGASMLVGAVYAVREASAWRLPLAVALEQVKDEYELLFRSINDGILLHEPAIGSGAGRFVRANDALCDLLGYTQAQLCGLAPQDIVARHDERPDGAAAAFEPGVVMETTLLARDGRGIVAEITSREFEHDGRQMVLSLVRDISGRKAAEDALKDADRRKTEFLAILAHELRNPLAPLRSALEVLRYSNGDEDVSSQARATMERQITHMVRLVDDLLDISRITRNKLELRKEQVDLSAVLRQAVEVSLSQAELAGHELSISLPAEPVRLEADSARLTQVFDNLLSNACKYTEAGGRITVTARREGTDVLVTVEDTGVGMPSEMLPQVFEMFTQVDSSLARAQGGLGIGLTLVKQLVEMHGGTVLAESEGAGCGSRFTVRLPVHPAAETMPALVSAPPEATPRLKRRVLVVDDNKDSAMMMAMLMHMRGDDACTAHDGPAAVETAGSYRPDVILLDIGLPKMNGYDVCRTIRAQPWGRDMVIVAVTGWGQDDDRRKSAEAGFDRHLVKPVAPPTLEKLMASCDSRSQAALAG